MDKYDEVKRLIARGEIAKSLNLLKQYNPDIEVDIIESRCSAFETKKVRGTLSHREEILEYNSIVGSILDLIKITDKDSKVNSPSTIYHKLDQILQGQSLILSQMVENHQLTFQNSQERLAFEQRLTEFYKHQSKKAVLSDEWYDRPIKDKLKLSIPFIVGKYEREYDLTGANFPKTWRELKRIFLKDEEKE